MPKYVRARYGHRADRIGEASNPGPESGDLQGGSQVAEVVNALEFDLTQQDSDSEVQSCSDTESVVQPCRRLQLVWDAHVADPRRAWHPEARGVEGLFHNLASRIGAVPEGSEVPRAVRQQRWSPANVPLMWGASGNADDPCVGLVDGDSREDVRAD